MYFNWQDLKKEIFTLNSFPSLFNLRMEWNFGFILILLYFFQIISGIILTFFFKVGLEDCLRSKSFIIKEVELGWLLSYCHSTTPNFIFFFMFFHIFKSLYNSIFSYSLVWFSGFIIFFLYILISFTGYSLVGGSLGFWAIVVFMGIIEFIFGEFFSFLLFSDFGAISDLILYKVYCYHFISSLLMGLVIFLHLYFIHILGSSIGTYSIFVDFFGFHLCCFFKDLFFQSFFMFFYTLTLGYGLEYFFSLDNFIELCIHSVPEEINSEWYLRWIFILLRSVDSKKSGVFYITSVLFFFGISFFFLDFIGERFFSKGSIYLLITSNWLLILFTLSKFGGSFYSTSGILFFLLFLLNYILVFLSKEKKIFLDFFKC